MHGHDILSSTVDEAQSHTYRSKCDKRILICRITYYSDFYFESLQKKDMIFLIKI